MRYEWDEAKAAVNLAKHGVAFAAIEGRLHVVVFMIRRAIRLISLRKANNAEIDHYENR